MAAQGLSPTRAQKEAVQDACRRVVAGTTHAPWTPSGGGNPHREKRSRTGFGCRPRAPGERKSGLIDSTALCCLCKESTPTGIVLSLVVLVVPLLIVLTVLASLGWLVLAVLTSLGWVGQRLLRATARMVRHA